MSIRIGYLLPTRERIVAEQRQAAPLLELAERAERLGFDSVWAGAPAKSPTSRRHWLTQGDASPSCASQWPPIRLSRTSCRRCRGGN